MLESGKQPAEVALMVEDAIRNRRSHIFTDRVFLPPLQDRFQRIVDCFPDE
jgi:hypothetical protein